MAIRKNKSIQRATNDNSIIRLGRLRTFLNELKNLFVAKEAGKGLSSNDFTDSLLTKLNGIEDKAQVNIIEAVLRNGVKLSINNKSVDINVPTKTSQIQDDIGFITNAVNNLINYYRKEETYTRDEIHAIDNLINYYTKSETYNKEEVNSLVSSLPHLRIEVVDTLPSQGEENVIYLVKKEPSGTDAHDEYIFINGNPEFLGTTAVDLTGYLTEKDIGEKIAGLNASKKIEQSNLPFADKNQYGAIKLPISESMLESKYQIDKNGGIPSINKDTGTIKNEFIPTATTESVGGIQLPIGSEMMSSDYQKNQPGGVLGIGPNGTIDPSYISLNLYPLTIRINQMETIYNPQEYSQTVDINSFSEYEIQNIANSVLLSELSTKELTIDGTVNGMDTWRVLDGPKTISIPRRLPNPEALLIKSYVDEYMDEQYDGTYPAGFSIQHLDLIPIGTIIMWANKDTIPDDWLLCDGQSITEAAFTTLYNVLGEDFHFKDVPGHGFVPNLKPPVMWADEEKDELYNKTCFIIKARPQERTAFIAPYTVRT